MHRNSGCLLHITCIGCVATPSYHIGSCCQTIISYTTCCQTVILSKVCCQTIILCSLRCHCTVQIALPSTACFSTLCAYHSGGYNRATPYHLVCVCACTYLQWMLQVWAVQTHVRAKCWQPYLLGKAPAGPKEHQAWCSCHQCKRYCCCCYCWRGV